MATEKIQIEPTGLELSLGDDCIKVTWCDEFNVEIYGFGSNEDNFKSTSFDSIEDLDIYIKLLQTASQKLKEMRKERKKGV